MHGVVDEELAAAGPTVDGARPAPPPSSGALGAAVEWTRVVVRGASLIGWTGVLFTGWLVGGALCRVRPAAHRSLRGRMFRLWGRGLLRVLGIVPEVRGRPPSPPCFVVSNHVSWVDIPLIASCFEGVFVAKAEIGGWPLAGTLSRSMNTIFVDRERRRDVVRVNEQVRAALDDRLGIVLFPEGGSDRGDVVRPFKSPLLEPAAAGEHGVYSASVSYVAPPGAWPASQVVCFWGDIGFVAHLLRLLRQPGGYRGRLTFGPAPVPAADRKTLARTLHAAVSAHFEPIP